MADQREMFDPMHAPLEDLLDHVNDVADDDRAWPRSLAELVDVLADDAISRGSEECEAFAHARRTIALIAHYFGGRMFYIPRNDKLRVALRDNQIWRRFVDPRERITITELAVEYDLTDQQLYTIIRQQKKLTISRKQRQLPLSE